MNYNLAKWTVAVACTVFVAGCTSGRPRDTFDFAQWHELEAAMAEVRVGPGDLVSISAPQILEVDGVRQQIDPAGKISLRLAGDVKVAGMTNQEIKAKLAQMLKPYYRDPKLNVEVSAKSRRIFVFGEGTANGAVPYTGHDTVLDVLPTVGNSLIAARKRVKIIRPTADPSQKKELTVNLARMMKTGDWTDNVLLQPNDIVYVPPTSLGWVGLRMRELLFPVQPVFEAYNMPAQFLQSNDSYHDARRDDDDDDGDLF
jgi:polysaccharide export outer membrane protein